MFVFTGIPGRRGPVPRELGNVMPGIVLGNQAVLGVTNPSADAYRAAVADLALFARRWPTLLPQLVTSRRPVAEAREVLEGSARGVKEVLIVRVTRGRPRRRHRAAAAAAARAGSFPA